MLNYKGRRKVKGQAGDTITWVVATIIIVVLLIFFIYVSSVLAKAKSVESFVKGIFSEKDINKADWISTKTSLAYEINDKNKQVIDKWIEENAKN